MSTPWIDSVRRPVITGRIMVTRQRYSKWLCAAVALPALAAILASVLTPEPQGHWSEHVTGAAMKAAQLLVLLALVTLLGWPKLRPVLLIAFAVIATGIVFQVLGDYQVAHSIWRTTGNPGSGIGYAAGHDRSESGDLLVLAGGLVFAAAAGFTRRVPAWLAVVGAVTMIIPPPFLWPAVGTLVLVLYGLTSASGWADHRAQVVIERAKTSV
ncbi:MAG: hypothetical protein ABI862_16300 [Ilumatobacteraceae bacterium]